MNRSRGRPDAFTKLVLDEDMAGGYMQHRQFGSRGSKVAVIGQGTWYDDGQDRASAISALRRGLDLGLHHIDTAEMYGSGLAEEIVGDAIAGRRHEVFLVSKVLPQNASKNGTMKACDRSLVRLRTDRLDCYLLHWRGSHPLEDTFDAFDRLRYQGKIGSWGVSNFDVADLDEARKIAGAGQLACNQVLYHLQERAIERAVVPWCARNDVAVVAYSPYGHGNFPVPRSDGGKVLKRIAEAHQATPRQVALRFLLRWTGLFAIPKSSTSQHVEENASAGDLNLTKSELEEIDRAFPQGSPPQSLPML